MELSPRSRTTVESTIPPQKSRLRLSAAAEQAAAPLPLLFGQHAGRGFLRLEPRDEVGVDPSGLPLRARPAQAVPLAGPGVLPDQVPTLVNELRSTAGAHRPLRLPLCGLALRLALVDLLQLDRVQLVAIGVVEGLAQRLPLLAPEPAPHLPGGPAGSAVIRSSSVTTTGTAWW